jgi:hydroxymethylglutaryl-CoA lyase
MYRRHRLYGARDGRATGIDLDALIDCALMTERIIGRPLGGRIMYSSLSRFRR